jgi:hypothetical protein
MVRRAQHFVRAYLSGKHARLELLDMILTRLETEHIQSLVRTKEHDAQKKFTNDFSELKVDRALQVAINKQV